MTRLKPAQRALATSVVALLALLGFAGPAHAVKYGPWVDYNEYRNSAWACEQRGLELERIYGGVHYGAILDSMCVPFTAPGCPPRTRFEIFVRYNIDTNGPYRVAPTQALPAAETDLSSPLVASRSSVPESATISAC